MNTTGRTFKLSNMTSGITWITFDCDGRSFEYAVVPSKSKSRPLGWPANEPSPGRWIPDITVWVRKVGGTDAPALVVPEGTVVTVETAREAARRFWEQLS